MYAYPTLSVPKLHYEYRIWMNELDFVNAEIAYFEKQLQHLENRRFPFLNRVKVNYFKTYFQQLKEVIQLIKTDLQEAEKNLALYVKEVSGMGLLSIKMDNHAELREEMSTFRKWFKTLKNDFRHSEREWLQT